MARPLAAGLAFLLGTFATNPASALPDMPREAAARSNKALDRIFQDWLTAFNSGDRARIKTVYARYADDPDPPLRS